MAQKATPFDIIINELMADPTPKIGLPDTEYIELYNRSDKTFNLNGFKIYNGSVNTTLTDFTLKPDSYVIIYTRKSSINFSTFGDTLTVSKLVSLNNPNDTFYLKSPEGIIIDAASYDLSYYRNSKKAVGGWSLERINPNAPCLTSGWSGSNDLKGGTPGQKNSVVIAKQDSDAPEIIYSFPINERTIQLRFDKTMDRNIATQNLHYSLNNGIRVNTVKIKEPLFEFVELGLDKTLQRDIRYVLTVKNTLKDCQGTPLSITDTIPIQLTEKAEFNDLVINELLFDPETGGSRFIELYNRSTKAIDLADIKIGDLSNSDIESVTTHYALLPRQYVALTESPFYIQNRYKAQKYASKMLKNRLPTWEDKKGNASIYTLQGNKKIIIDSFDYHRDLHNLLLANTEGVSLERINMEKSTHDASNWHSAAATVGYGTPGYQNSQYMIENATQNLSSSDDIFSLLSNTFSPDDDGFQDYLLLEYKLNKPGYLANISIFNIDGLLIKKLLTNELLQLSGQVKWNGETNERLIAPVGAYIVVIELVNPNGKISRLKKACVLTNKY